LVTTETRARVHVVLGRLIQALQYAGRTNLAGRLTPAVPLGTAASLSELYKLIPRDGRNAHLREAASMLSDAYFAIATDNEREAIAKYKTADSHLVSFFNSAVQPT
jgi:hypothetical protein